MNNVSSRVPSGLFSKAETVAYFNQILSAVLLWLWLRFLRSLRNVCASICAEVIFILSSQADEMSIIPYRG
jgi:hypothetical protein